MRPQLNGDTLRGKRMAGEPDLGIVADGQDEYVAGLRKRCSEELRVLERRCEAAGDDHERAVLRAEMEVSASATSTWSARRRSRCIDRSVGPAWS